MLPALSGCRGSAGDGGQPPLVVSFDFIAVHIHLLGACNSQIPTAGDFFHTLTAKLFNLNFHPLEVVSR